MRKIGLLVCLVCSIWGPSVLSQIVETVIGPSPRINNGLVVHPSGEIYGSDLFGSGFNGNSVYRIVPDGTPDLYATGLSQPAGLAFDQQGTLYVAEFSSGEISKVDSQGLVTVFVSGLNQPADMVFDHSGNLYVTNYGNGTISRIEPDGSKSNLTSGLNQPVGLAIGPDNYLYSANLNDGKIFRIDSLGSKELLATVSDVPVGFMTYADGSLYLASTGGHRIYQISMSGTVNAWLGTGVAGSVDGDESLAQFTHPDGIAASPSGDTLYVSENNTHLLRRIIRNTSTNLKVDPLSLSVKLFPNPTRHQVRLSFQLPDKQYLSIRLMTQEGRFLQPLFEGSLQQGTHQFDFDLGELPASVYYVLIQGDANPTLVPLQIER